LQEILLNFVVSFFRKKDQNEIINLVEIKKPLHLHSQLKKGSNKKAKRSLKVWKQQHVPMYIGTQ
jgi:hypothetical protein